MNDETIKIPKCPMCDGTHVYRIEVERSLVVHLMDSSFNEQPRKVKITRLFTCPQKDQVYQATFILYDTSSSRIKSVTILGLAEGGD